jgi:formamidopyrimidine-DNA glycosylase
MYDKILNQDGTTAHSNECKMVFGRKDKDCPRCVELLSGSKPRDRFPRNARKTQDELRKLYGIMSA